MCVWNRVILALVESDLLVLACAPIKVDSWRTTKATSATTSATASSASATTKSASLHASANVG